MSKKKKAVDPKIARILRENNLGIKLDIGCGANKQEGFVGLDILPLKGVDIVQNLETFPWPLPDECASFAMASHVVEHINPAGGIFLKFMDEVWRVLKPGARFAIAVPYAGSQGYWQDPTHCNGCNEITWTYFDPLAETGYYRFYKPKPWKIVPGSLSWQVHGFMEVVLEKRLMDPSYE